MYHYTITHFRRAFKIRVRKPENHRRLKNVRIIPNGTDQHGSNIIKCWMIIIILFIMLSCVVSSVCVSLGLYAFHMTHHLYIGFDFFSLFFSFLVSGLANILFIRLTLVYCILLLLNYYNIRNVFGSGVHWDGWFEWQIFMECLAVVVYSFPISHSFDLNAGFHNTIKWFDVAKCKIK